MTARRGTAIGAACRVPDRVVPPLHRAPAAGRRWSGWFGARGCLAARRSNRVVLGRFVADGARRL
jgi:hypothetical protein